MNGLLAEAFGGELGEKIASFLAAVEYGLPGPKPGEAGNPTDPTESD